MGKQRKILFIGLSCIGDVIMTTPVMQSLHQHFPEARLDVVADARSQTLYAACPYVDRIFIKDKTRFLRGAPALLLELRSHTYDMVVDLRTDGLAYLIKTGQRYTKRHALPYGPHAVEKTMGVIAKLHGNQPIPKTTVWLNDAHRAYADEKLSTFTDKGRLLALSTGEPSKPSKNWKTENWIKFLDNNKHKFSGIVYVGGPNEHAATETIKQAVACLHVDIVAEPLLETAAVLEKTMVYIGPDSGLGHLASAVNTSTITLFSNFSPAQYQPWGSKALSIRGANDDARNISVADMEAVLGRFFREQEITLTA